MFLNLVKLCTQCKLHDNKDTVLFAAKYCSCFAQSCSYQFSGCRWQESEKQEASMGTGTYTGMGSRNGNNKKSNCIANHRWLGTTRYQLATNRTLLGRLYRGRSRILQGGGGSQGNFSLLIHYHHLKCK